MWMLDGQPARRWRAAPPALRTLVTAVDEVAPVALLALLDIALHPGRRSCGAARSTRRLDRSARAEANTRHAAVRASGGGFSDPPIGVPSRR
jgi:hypothetical protein